MGSVTRKKSAHEKTPAEKARVYVWHCEKLSVINDKNSTRRHYGSRNCVILLVAHRRTIPWRSQNSPVTYRRGRAVPRKPLRQ